MGSAPTPNNHLLALHRARACAGALEAFCAGSLFRAASPHLDGWVVDAVGIVAPGGTIAHLGGAKILYRTFPGAGKRKNHKSYDTRLHAVSVPRLPEIAWKT